MNEFYKCHNNIVKEIFQQHFDKLIIDYSNSKNYLEFLYKTKTSWAYCYTAFKFTESMIATSRIESMNACLKRLLHNSNITIYDFVKEIHVLLDRHDKENEYNFWRLSIPSIKNQKKVNFLFTKVNQCLQ